jgi:hypothetical protein
MNQKRKIKSFAVWKTAKIGAIVTLALSALAVVPMLVLMTLGRTNHTFKFVHPHDFRDACILFSALPLIYGTFALFLIALTSWLYNLLSPRFGGIEVELMAMADPASSQSIPPNPAN